jgi:hypothetical protein
MSENDCDLKSSLKKIARRNISKNSYIQAMAYRWGLGRFNPPPPRNSEVLTKQSRIPSNVVNTSVTTSSEYGIHSFAY